ncbi:MAG: hypothetical protein KatS3mg002_0253 [Candidatus Woesearchaeota archaeon]|nr:MAG: hypothetical protein KatS3mg002_0253 [Candidatus Woesearchaeota archaeon]
MNLNIQDLLKNIQTTPTTSVNETKNNSVHKIEPQVLQEEPEVEVETEKEIIEENEKEINVVSLSKWWNTYRSNIYSIRSLTIMNDSQNRVMINKCIIFVAPSKQEKGTDDLFPVVNTHKIKVPNLAASDMMMFHNGYMIEFPLQDDLVMRWYGIRLTHTIFYGFYNEQNQFIPIGKDQFKSRKNSSTYEFKHFEKPDQIPSNQYVDIRLINEYYPNYKNDQMITFNDFLTEFYAKHDNVKDINHAIKIIDVVMGILQNPQLLI